jgi:hypothetical protein
MHARQPRFTLRPAALVKRWNITRTQGISHSAAPGRREEAFAALEHALERYERKKNLAMVAQVRPKLEALRNVAPP